MKILLACGAAAAALAAGPAFSLQTQDDAAEPAAEARENYDGGENNMNMTDTQNEAQTFASKAALSGMLEVRSSELAQEQANSRDVQDFAQMMIEDHTAANDKLMGIVAGKTFDAPDTLDEDHQAKLDELQDAEEFDRAYLDMQEEAHEKAVSLFESYAENGEDEDLRTFAENTLPTLEQHLERVREIREGFDVRDDAFGLGSGEDDGDGASNEGGEPQ